MVRRKPYADILYLTWITDPLTTMTVQWHTIERRVGVNPDCEIKYREINTEIWNSVTGTNQIIPYPDVLIEKERLVHWTTITGLQAGTNYEFKFSGDTTEQIYKFKTMPLNLNTEQIKIAFAGDCHYGIDDIFDMSHENIEMVTSEIKKSQPDIFIGLGDLVYDDGEVHAGVTYNWVRFLKMLQEHLIKDDGYLIPFITAFGNHDGARTYLDIENGAPYDKDNNATYFSKLFAFPKSQNHLFGDLIFGDYLQLLCLESGYANPISECTQFLTNNIDNTKKHIIPFYHIPLYAYRGNSITNNTEAIAQWETIFGSNGVKISMSGHLHSYSYTKPLLNGAIVTGNNGVVYCGNGSWALNRPSYSFSEPVPDWIAKQAHGDYDERNVNHFYLVTLYNTKLKVDSINKYGETFDSFERLI
jgi:hypothetical protein